MWAKATLRLYLGAILAAVWAVCLCANPAGAAPSPAAAGPAALRPRVVQTRFPCDDVVIATLVVPPARNAATDMTATVQKAIDRVAAGGGGVVFLPAGRYRFDGRLTLKEGVTLRGDWPGRDSKEVGKGTILMPYADRGKADGPPFITMERGTGVRNLSVWYPEQKPDKIAPYPWTFRTSATKDGDNITIQNATLVNPYQAIKIGPEWNELHTIRNVIGTPLKTGIWMDTTTDIGRVVDVEFDINCWLGSRLDMSEDQRRNACPALDDYLAKDQHTGIELRRSDWEYFDTVKVEGYGTALLARPGQKGTANAVLWRPSLGGWTALGLDGLNPVGLAVSGAEIRGWGLAVHASRRFRSPVLFHSCKLEGHAASSVLLAGGGTLAFARCAFGILGPVEPPRVFLQAGQGTVSIICSSLHRGDPAVALGRDVRTARLLGIIVGSGVKRIWTYKGEGDVLAASFPRTSDWAETVANHVVSSVTPKSKSVRELPTPGAANLLRVTDYGAKPQAADNTAAFRKALAAAKGAGGGTVYVPAGNWRLAGSITVPTGVELRGCWDVPHHTISGGSVLMPTGGRGKEDAAPFIQLEKGSGLRGFTVWWPEQSMAEPVAYPWAVRGLGPKCWIINVTLGNAWQGVDFWTHDSTGHYVSYLAGGFFRRGLFVSKSDGGGWVEDVQFNPHYMGRVHPSLPRPGQGRDAFGKLIQYQQANLEGIVFGRCKGEMIRRTFLYAAWGGLVFRDDRGGTDGVVINHGSDACSRALVLEKTGPKGLRMYNTQLVPLGRREVGAIVATREFTGRAELYNTQIWGGRTSGVIDGKGTIVLEQLNTLCGPFVLKGGSTRILGGYFQRTRGPHVVVEKGVARAELLANIAKSGEFRVANAAGDKLYARANSLPLPPRPGRSSLATGWEAGEPAGPVNTVQTQGGGIRKVSKATCGPSSARAHTGKRSLRIAGQADDPSYSFVYFRILNGPVVIQGDSELSYWLRPSNERGRCVGVDLLFTDGSTLRDSGLRYAHGRGTHPGDPKGAVGRWTRKRLALGPLAGKTIRAVMLAYDSRGGGGAFEAFVDDLAITSSASTGAAPTFQPAGGRAGVGTRITLVPPKAGQTMRYTLDGLTPTSTSPKYTAPLVLDKPGLWEVRGVTDAAGNLGRVRAALYEVVPAKK